MSINNVFFHAGDPVKRYIKTVKHSVSGKRLNPETGIPIEFLLANDGEPAYEHDVIELYSDKEVKYFFQANRYLIEHGFLKEHASGPEHVDEANLLSDDDVEEIASTKQLSSLKNKLQAITSPITLGRIYDAAVVIGRSQRVLEEIKQRISSVS